MKALYTRNDPPTVVTVMAMKGIWAMVRHPGCMPFVAHVRDELDFQTPIPPGSVSVEPKEEQ